LQLLSRLTPSVRRLASLLVVLALLGATAAAFAVSERLKLEKSPIVAPDVPKTFSPVCECEKAGATIAFGLRKDDRVSLWVVDAKNEVVRELADAVPASGRFQRRWNGRDNEGRIVPDGVYRPRLRLAHGRRTFVLPNAIRVDTVAPTVKLVSAKPQFFSPDGDGRNDRVRLRYTLTEPASAILLAKGAQAGRTRFRPLEGKLDWYGTIGGRKQQPGLYPLQLSAEDSAGNLAPRTKPVFVELSYIALGRSLVRAKARTRFGIRVSTDASRFTWRFAGGHGTGQQGLLVLRAPRAGRYTLYVQANGHADKAAVIVTPRTKSRRSAR
jgi:hypothetical protein